MLLGAFEIFPGSWCLKKIKKKFWKEKCWVIGKHFSKTNCVRCALIQEGQAILRFCGLFSLFSFIIWEGLVPLFPNHLCSVIVLCYGRHTVSVRPDSITFSTSELRRAEKTYPRCRWITSIDTTDIFILGMLKRRFYPHSSYHYASHNACREQQNSTINHNNTRRRRRRVRFNRYLVKEWAVRLHSIYIYRLWVDTTHTCRICFRSATARCARYRADQHTLADAAVLLLLRTLGSWLVVHDLCCLNGGILPVMVA